MSHQKLPGARSGSAGDSRRSDGERDGLQSRKVSIPAGYLREYGFELPEEKAAMQKKRSPLGLGPALPAGYLAYHGFDLLAERDPAPEDPPGDSTAALAEHVGPAVQRAGSGRGTEEPAAVHEPLALGRAVAASHCRTSGRSNSRSGIMMWAA